VYTNANQSLTAAGLAATTDADLRADLDVITDWAAGGTNLIDLSGFNASLTFVAQATVQAAVDAATPASLLDAFTAAATAVGADEVGVFQFGGNTYVFAQDDQDTLGPGDLAIELTGQHNLIAANFVLAEA
jgi:hypothetical protein